MWYSADMDSAVVAKLKVYFAGRDDVAFAFLFGSQAKGTARAVSDWDVGVFFSPGSETVSEEMRRAVEEITGAPTDLVVLNRAPAHIAWSIIRGKPLTIKQRRMYLNFLTTTSHEANDWHYTARDYHHVFERSESLSAEDRGRLEKTAQFLGVELSDAPQFQKMSWQEYASNRVQKRNIERWAEQLMNAVIDIAEIVLASEKRVIPESYKEIVRELGLVPPFGEQKLCEQVSEWVSFRNDLAHEYLDYRWRRISVFLRSALPLLVDFKTRLQRFLSQP